MRLIILSGILFLLESFSSALSLPCHADFLSGEEFRLKKEEIERRYEEERAIGRQNPAPRNLPETDPLPPVEEPALEFGIADNVAAPFPAQEFVSTNGWLGMVDDTLLTVYAGLIGGSLGQGGVAVISVASEEAEPQFSFHESPIPVGALRIVEEAGEKLTLVGDTGATFLFDLRTLTFSTNPVNQLPIAKCKSITESANSSCTVSAPSVDNGSSDPDLGDTVTITQSPAVGTLLGLGLQPVTLTVTDSHNATAQCTANVTVQDTTPPSIICPGALQATASSTAGSKINFDVSSSDNCSISIPSCSPSSGSTFPVGVTPVSCTATDGVGLQNMCSFSASVIYPFTGFLQPVDNLPTVNTMKAGQAVPVKFSLGGNFGLNILAVGSPVSQQIACASGAPLDDIEETVSAGSSGLQYDATTNIYTYVWKTDTAWANQCRQFTITLADKTIHVSQLKFK